MIDATAARRERDFQTDTRSMRLITIDSSNFAPPLIAFVVA